mmetsp:Transcript_179/g.560  ORF Transcript_179/g.560 Transcript_179/m.560 type:complete len:209 (-) Transcript_179:709-1335(-)
MATDFASSSHRRRWPYTRVTGWLSGNALRAFSTNTDAAFLSPRASATCASPNAGAANVPSSCAAAWYDALALCRSPDACAALARTNAASARSLAVAVTTPPAALETSVSVSALTASESFVTRKCFASATRVAGLCGSTLNALSKYSSPRRTDSTYTSSISSLSPESVAGDAPCSSASAAPRSASGFSVSNTSVRSNAFRACANCPRRS